MPKVELQALVITRVTMLKSIIIASNLLFKQMLMNLLNCIDILCLFFSLLYRMDRWSCLAVWLHINLSTRQRMADTIWYCHSRSSTQHVCMKGNFFVFFSSICTSNSKMLVIKYTLKGTGDMKNISSRAAKCYTHCE